MKKIILAFSERVKAIRGKKAKKKSKKFSFQASAGVDSKVLTHSWHKGCSLVNNHRKLSVLIES